MSLSRRDVLKFGGATAAGVAAGSRLDLAPVEAAATDLKIKTAKVSRSVCPYCAVGCGQLVYSKDNRIIDIEGDPDTPHTLGKLCPKGAATIQLSNNKLRPTKALYRAAGSDKWEEKPLDWMYAEISKRYYETREKHFIEKEKTKDGADITVNRLEAIASLGSACIDNEEAYLLTKFNRSLGIVYHEHQARV
ncbi:MAG TPA: twin-arginine translocation signal domain-containing protein [Methylomirabilota bacterium]|nr:twin-arginine translocation signal domain-containing protein [Methylomirabilota bacterium]